MNSTYLTDWATEGPFVVFKDRMYDLIPDTKPNKNSLSIGGKNMLLVPSEKLITLENIFMEQAMDQKLGQKGDVLGRKLAQAHEAYKKIESTAKRNAMGDFIYHFLNNWSKAGTVQRYEPPKPEIVSIPTKIPYHDYRERRSTLVSIVETIGFLCMAGNVYYTKKTKNDEQDHLILNGNGYALKVCSSVSDFDKLYGKKLIEHLKKRINHSVEKAENQLIALRQEYNGTDTDTRLASHESSTGEVGYFKDNGDYYLYINCHSFIERSAALSSRFRFPSCKLGVKLTYKNGRLNYDISQESGKIRVLASKDISNGREVGTMKNLKHKKYAHPASTDTTNNDYPLMCITGEEWPYPEPTAKRSLEKCIEIALRKTLQLLGNTTQPLDYDEDLTLYSYLDYNYNMYKNNEIK